MLIIISCLKFVTLLVSPNKMGKIENKCNEKEFEYQHDDGGGGDDDLESD